MTLDLGIVDIVDEMLLIVISTNFAIEPVQELEFTWSIQKVCFLRGVRAIGLWKGVLYRYAERFKENARKDVSFTSC